MPNVLTRLKITEVSAVDKGAGDGTKIVLMKRDDDRPRSKPHLERYLRRLRKRESRSFNAIIKQLDDQEISTLTGAQYPRTRLPDLDDDDDGDTIDRDRELLGENDDDAELDEVITKALRDHHNGHHSLSAALVQHLHDRLERRRERHGYTKRKESNMRHTETLESIMKDGSVTGVCAAIVAKGSTTLTQDEIVSAVGKVAQERYPELSEAQAFSKIYSDGGAEGRVLRSAINVAKASLAETMLGPGLPVQVVGGPNAMLDAVGNDQSEIEQARAELMRIGRKQYPRSTENEVFERALSDPRNATIVARLYQRPLPSSIYPMPREWLQGEGSQHAKADHGSAYNELMQKAEEYRNAHPEMSISQAFEKIYTDRGNIELAKRERVESAPR
jgi:hypothetical protein